MLTKLYLSTYLYQLNQMESENLNNKKLLLSGDEDSGGGSSRKTGKAIGIMAGGATIILLALGVCFLWRKKKLQLCLMNLKGKTEQRGNVPT